MRQLYQIFGTYWILEEAQSFYETMPPSGDHLKYFFSSRRFESLHELLKNNLITVGMSSKDIVDGWDFEDDELLSVVGKQSIKDSDQMYSEILRVVRLNPLNKNPLPKGFNRYVKPLLIGKL